MLKGKVKSDNTRQLKEYAAIIKEALKETETNNQLNNSQSNRIRAERYFRRDFELWRT